MTTKKDQRWAMIPPKEPAPDDVTQTHRRIRAGEDASGQHASGQHVSGQHASGQGARADQRPPGDPTSRRRKRTEPELPALNELAEQVAVPTPLPRLAREDLSSPSREAITVPPETSPTMASPVDELESSPLVTLIDLTPEGASAQSLPATAIVERSRATGPVPSEGGETLPSPPWHDDDV